MIMLQGLAARSVGVGGLLAVWLASLFGNLTGSIGFAAIVNGGGTLSAAAGSPAGKMGAGEALIAAAVTAKNAATGPQLFWRSVLCNELVCLALWMAARTRSDAAKLIVLWWGLLPFIASGFEHSVANMTVFGLGIFQGHAAWLGRPASAVSVAPEPISAAVEAPLRGTLQPASLSAHLPQG